MTGYLRFETADGVLLVESDLAEVAAPADGTGEQQAGLGHWARNQAGEVVALAQTGFEQAVTAAVGVNARAFLGAVKALTEPPEEVELTFGLKGTGEIGNVAVGKIAGECSYQVKLVWRLDPAAKHSG